MADAISVREFNELIIFRQPDRIKSGKGQVKETWTNYRKALVKIIESGNDERKEGDRINLPGVLTVSGHYDSGVNSTFRIIWNTVEFNITSITPVQNRRYMVIRAEKVFE
jgi:head-tail adaptor